MGGHGSGRKPNPMKQFMPQRANITEWGGDPLEIPNLGAAGKNPMVRVDIVDLIYPIGSIYISTVATNPNTLFNKGTWIAFGTGKTLISLDSGDADFDTSEETGGAKTHAITSDEMPSHTHTLTMDEHIHAYSISASTGTLARAERGATHTQDGSTRATTSTGTNASTGGGTASTIVQPYIVVFMFKRTA